MIFFLKEKRNKSISWFCSKIINKKIINTNNYAGKTYFYFFRPDIFGDRQQMIDSL